MEERCGAWFVAGKRKCGKVCRDALLNAGRDGSSNVTTTDALPQSGEYGRERERCQTKLGLVQVKLNKPTKSKDHFPDLKSRL